MMWLRMFEGYLVARLLASPTFHKFVASIAHRVANRGRGPMSSIERGGTHEWWEEGKNRGGVKRFLQLYIDEFKKEFRK
ncbi:hypothetical protein BJ508DRAFT_411684 [Ascobolus immersus RN42]|uniref:Uncharacterized protein n=1 Tax=Ascobolus immersus RN42 TaxID=1160509 RepID=A0A3N4IJ62_ASCIM|nr:hypothetical protein BJ508DRAFT_411684 [Ascobolus immersus RN42]